MLFKTAILSGNGGCVLNNPRNICFGEKGATIINAAVVCGTFIGIRLLYASSFSRALINP